MICDGCDTAVQSHKVQAKPDVNYQIDGIQEMLTSEMKLTRESESEQLSDLDVAQNIIDAGESGLWTQVEQMLMARLKIQPDDRLMLSRLAAMYRQRGDLDAAANVYDRLVAMNPDDHSSELLAALCSGQPAPRPVPKDQVSPAPFVKIPDFLPCAARQELLDLLLRNQSNLEELDVNYVGAQHEQDAKRDRSIRLQYGVYCEAELRAIFEPLLTPRFPEFVEALQAEPFDAAKQTLRLDTTPDGGFGKMHQDVGFGARLIYLYYFHTHPKKFTGGDLLLYDQHVTDNAPAHDSFTTLRHVDNTLVVFEPHYFHQVTKVNATEGTLSPLDSRLSVCGFVHPAM